MVIVMTSQLAHKFAGKGSWQPGVIAGGAE